MLQFVYRLNFCFGPGTSTHLRTLRENDWRKIDQRRFRVDPQGVVRNVETAMSGGSLPAYDEPEITRGSGAPRYR
ncbi:hypothetical protein EMIT0P12_50372 [Pseudomonas sp. IT-P12]